MAGALQAHVFPHDHGSRGDLVERDILPQPNGGHGRRKMCHEVLAEGGDARPDRGELALIKVLLEHLLFSTLVAEKSQIMLLCEPEVSSPEGGSVWSLSYVNCVCAR